MSIRVIFFLVTALFLVQYSVGKPTTEDVEDKDVNQSVDSNESPSLSKDKEVIRNIIRAEVIKVVNQYLKDARKRTEAVVDELNEMDEKSEDIKAIIDELSEIRNKLTAEDVQDSMGDQWGVKGVFKKITVLSELQHVENKYNVKLKENPTDEVILLGNLMKKHRPVTTQVDKFKRQFVEKCEEALAVYFNSLTSKEQEDRKEMSDWLQEFKEETDVYKKTKKIEEFLPDLIK